MTTGTDKKPATTNELPKPPEGMKQADTDLDNQDKWDFDKHPVLEGEVQKIKNWLDQEEDPPRKVRFAVIITKDGEETQLWESANLREFFDALKPGTEIWVLYKGMEKLQGKKSMRMFDAFYS